MPVFHVNTSYISRGGSASGFANYLHRLHDDQATQLRRYIDREGRAKEDLIASGHDHLPAWANGDDHTFWLAADRYERKNGVVARVVELSLPRELSAQGQRDLADDIREVYFSEHAHSWAIHAPAARDGSGGQPHMHVMFSPRTNDGMDRSPQQHFRRYNQKHPDVGGARKDPSWDTKGRLADLRWGVALLSNAALEREHIPLAVTHLSLRAQGLDRDPARYANPHDTHEKATVQTYRNRLHQGGEKTFEMELIRTA
jgi:hypothetical protein